MPIFTAIIHLLTDFLFADGFYGALGKEKGRMFMKTSFEERYRLFFDLFSSADSTFCKPSLYSGHGKIIVSRFRALLGGSISFRGHLEK